ncbi:Carnosine N-methyltransferase 2 [Holothuria leucospilota]|uniref:Carnosine N-methyltransferase 2 n=1 Tax=Holothuria leucospilota TaxID=206669 RepID=A0A9Q1BJQ2_HOLLE|nr:Carnosine N-methyltransferase 2 [Holothuria leucospilota]
MDVSFLPQLDYLSSYYNESFASYKRHTNEYEKMLEWISDRFDAEITSKLLKKENEDGNVTLSVLGIGSGDGKLDVEMLIRLKKKFGTIECTVVEPSAERITSYKKLVQERKDALDGVTFDWRQITLQEFCKISFDRSNKFQFVCAMHSLYYIPKQELDYYIKTLFEWTEGIILMMHGTGRRDALAVFKESS